MIEKLFSSKARLEILKLFVFRPGERFYQRQIACFTHQPIRAIQREVVKLCAMGLVEAASEGNRLYYKVNRKCPILPDLKNIILKSIGIAEALRSVLQKHHSIDVAFIYGSYAKGSEKLTSDIDLFVVGGITLRELSALLSGVKRELGREINYVVFPSKELRVRVSRKDHFLNTVLREKKIFLIGNDNELKKIAGTGKDQAA